MTKVIVYKSCGEMFYEAESDIWLVLAGFWAVLGQKFVSLAFNILKLQLNGDPKVFFFFTLYSKRPHDFEKITLGLGAMSTNAS